MRRGEKKTFHSKIYKVFVFNRLMENSDLNSKVGKWIPAWLWFVRKQINEKFSLVFIRSACEKIQKNNSILGKSYKKKIKFSPR